MSFSYDPSNILTNDLDWVRFTIKDKDPDNYYVEDEEINALLIDNDKGIVAYLCSKDIYIAKSDLYSKNKHGDSTIEFDAGNRLVAYKELVDDLFDKYMSGTAVAAADYGDPIFTLGQFDDPGRNN